MQKIDDYKQIKALRSTMPIFASKNGLLIGMVAIIDSQRTWAVQLPCGFTCGGYKTRQEVIDKGIGEEGLDFFVDISLTNTQPQDSADYKICRGCGDKLPKDSWCCPRCVAGL